MVEVPPEGLEGISIIKSIGNGAYGEVFVGYDEALEQFVALKELDIEFIKKQNKVQNVMREKDILTKLSNYRCNGVISLLNTRKVICVNIDLWIDFSKPVL